MHHDTGRERKAADSIDQNARRRAVTADRIVGDKTAGAANWIVDAASRYGESAAGAATLASLRPWQAPWE